MGTDDVLKQSQLNPEGADMEECWAREWLNQESIQLCGIGCIELAAVLKKLREMVTDGARIDRDQKTAVMTGVKLITRAEAEGNEFWSILRLATYINSCR